MISWHFPKGKKQLKNCSFDEGCGNVNVSSKNGQSKYSGYPKHNQ